MDYAYLPYLDRSHLVLLCTPEQKSLDSLLWQASPLLEEERETPKQRASVNASRTAAFRPLGHPSFVGGDRN